MGRRRRTIETLKSFDDGKGLDKDWKRNVSIR